MISDKWMQAKLIDVCEFISRGITPSYTNKGGVIVINQKCIRNNTVNFKASRLTNPNKKRISKQKYLKPYDILINSTGVGTLGRVAQLKNVKELITCDSHVTIVRANEKVYPEYLGYNLFMQHSNIERLAEGSTGQTELSKTRLGEVINLYIPPLKEQKAIAHILSNLDGKIDVNNQIIKALEKIAQLIFKHWFVDFEFPNEEGKPYKSSGGKMVESELGMIPEGWKLKALGKVLNTIEAGNRPKGGAGNLNKGIPSIGAENIIGLGKYNYSKEKYVSYDYFKNMNKGIIKSGDVLLYKDGAKLGRKTIFMNGYPHEKCCVNSHVFILRTNELISQSYLYFWLDQDCMTKDIINLNANSAQPGINQVQVKSLKILIPDKSIINKFDIIILSLLKRIFLNCNINNELTQLRDTLLPKLMSGEIRVPLGD